MNDETANVTPKLCVNCKHIATNGQGYWETYKCFAPQNKSRINFVTGGKIYAFPYCIVQRDAQNIDDKCGAEGKWFEQAPPKTLIEGVKYVPTKSALANKQPISADDL